jgi:hypothetical protein
MEILLILLFCGLLGKIFIKTSVTVIVLVFYSAISLFLLGLVVMLFKTPEKLIIPAGGFVIALVGYLLFKHYRKAKEEEVTENE